MHTIVMKFGGSSLANAERMRHVASLLEKHLPERPILVLSAIGKTTNDLIEAGRAALAGHADAAKIVKTHVDILLDLNLSVAEVAELLDELSRLLQGISLIRELTPRTMDYLMSFGERLSIRLFSAYLRQRGIAAIPLDGWEAGLRTTSDFNRAELLPEAYERIANALQDPMERGIPVVTGFIAKDLEGNITTMGRGGSDLTASAIGAALGVREIQVWKDVHGIFSMDPRVVESACPIPFLSFEEASELAYFGAKVLHPLSMLPAMKKGIPVRVKNSYDPDHPGTLIMSDAFSKQGFVTAITQRPHQTMVHICSTRMLGQHGFLAKVFQIFADLRLSVDVIATSEISISLTLEDRADCSELERRLGEIAAVEIFPAKTIVSLIGNTGRSAHILEGALKTLSQNGIPVQMISHGASRVNTSLVIDDGEAERGVCLLHSHFFQKEGIGS